MSSFEKFLLVHVSFTTDTIFLFMNIFFFSNARDTNYFTKNIYKLLMW